MGPHCKAQDLNIKRVNKETDNLSIIYDRLDPRDIGNYVYSNLIPIQFLPS